MNTASHTECMHTSMKLFKNLDRILYTLWHLADFFPVLLLVFKVSLQSVCIVFFYFFLTFILFIVFFSVCCHISHSFIGFSSSFGAYCIHIPWDESFVMVSKNRSQIELLFFISFPLFCNQLTTRILYKYVK